MYYILTFHQFLQMDTGDKATLLTALGKTIRELRLERNMTQAELAEAGDFHRNFISDLERGNKQPSFLTIVHLAYAFEMKSSELLQRFEELIEIK